MDIDKQYDEIGPDYLTGQNNYFNNKEDPARILIAKCLPNLNNKKVLDVGCGFGKDILTYEKLGAKEVYGVDPSKYMINEAKKIVKDKEKVVLGNVESMPYKDGQFDVVVSRFSLHYLKNLDKAYNEISRVLKKGGVFISVVHHPLLGFVQLGSKDYLKQDIIEMNLYNNKVKIKFYHHTIKNYFSEEFFKSFILDYVDEEPVSQSEYPNKNNIPGHIAFRAIRR